MPIVGAIMVPHPPLIVPEVGRGGEAQIRKTTEAYQRAADFIAALRPDTLVITSPHSVMYSDYFHISPGKGAKGNFGQFRAPQISFDVDYDAALVKEICRISNEQGLSAGDRGERDKALDHGTMVPLYFLRQAYEAAGISGRLRIVRIGLSGLPLREHYRLGQIIREAADNINERVAVIGSGDLSHKLQDYGPYGFAPEGPQYDERIMDVMGRGAFGELFNFDENFCDKAAECGHRSFVILAGTLDGTGVQVEKLSHEDVTGVGYGVCTFLPTEQDESRRFLALYDQKLKDEIARMRSGEDTFVALARQSLEYWFRYHRVMPLPEGLPDALTQIRAGAFVSLHEYGRLRGCVGTILPTTDCVGEEIIQNALSAALRDSRFNPVTADELRTLEYSVDELSPLEEIESEAQLDPKKYGVIVTKGSRRGLLLPDLDGVDTVEEQVSIAKRKAGIGAREQVQLSRFTVTRHK